MKVISAGNCDFDGPKIARLVEECGGQCVSVDTVAQLKEAIGEHQPKLILLNRIFDMDQTKSIPLIQEMKGDDNYKNIPMMIISNYKESQEEAVAVGALDGFGKKELDSEETKAKLRHALNS